MRLILVFITLIVLGIMMVPLRQLSEVGGTFIGGIAGVEAWVPMIFTAVPIIIPLAILVFGVMYIVKGNRRKEE